MRRMWEFRKGGGKQRPAAEEKLVPFFERENGWDKNGTPKIGRNMD